MQFSERKLSLEQNSYGTGSFVEFKKVFISVNIRSVISRRIEANPTFREIMSEVLQQQQIHKHTSSFCFRATNKCDGFKRNSIVSIFQLICKMFDKNSSSIFCCLVLKFLFIAFMTTIKIILQGLGLVHAVATERWL